MTFKEPCVNTNVLITYAYSMSTMELCTFYWNNDDDDDTGLFLT